MSDEQKMNKPRQQSGGVYFWRTCFCTVRASHVLTGPAMDTRNIFDAPNAIRPVAFSGTVVDGKLVFDLPHKAVAVE